MEDVRSALFSKEWHRKLRDDALMHDEALGLVIQGRDEHRGSNSKGKSRSESRCRKPKGHVKCFEYHKEGAWGEIV